MYKETKKGEFELGEIKKCKYYLPCGMCDKTGNDCICVQWSFSITPSNIFLYPSPCSPYTDPEKKSKKGKTVLNEEICVCEDNEERNL